MAKAGTYRFAYTYIEKDAAGTVLYETGRSPIKGPVTVTGSCSVGGKYSTNTRITHVRIYSTLTGGSVYYQETDIANNVSGGDWWTTLSMSDDLLKVRSSAYWTNKGYESKRLYTDGVAPPLAYVVEAAGRLWGCGRMHTSGTNEDATLYWSELAPYWCDWPAVNGISTFAKPLTGIYEWNENIYVFTRESRWKVVPEVYNEGISAYKLEGEVGCLGHHTIQKVGPAVLWLGQDGFYATVGDEVPILISDAIRGTLDGLDMNRARFAVSHYDPAKNEYECWLSLKGSKVNDVCLVADLTDGIQAAKWYRKGGLGRTVYYVTSAVVADGKRVKFYGDHLGCVWQEHDDFTSDGANDGGTYQGPLSYGTTSSTTTSTTTSTSTTT